MSSARSIPCLSLDEHGARGLDDPRHEHDACGVGFVADLKGRASHKVVTRALEAVARMVHRGAVNADGRTGDGAGILTALPYALLRSEGWHWGTDDSALAIGMFFLPQDPQGKGICTALIEQVITALGLTFLGWRDVPTRHDTLGQVARETCPLVAQALIVKPSEMDRLTYTRRLYVARRLIGKRVGVAGLSASFSMPSLSSETVVYKGLMMANAIGDFYPDLQDARYVSAVAVFHQRYSTNTRPSWALAQPLRMLAHNGEINTLKGNVNWMRAREGSLSCWADGMDADAVLPVIDVTGSDSTSLDNVFELLVLAGRSPLHAMRMLVPEAYEASPDMDPDLKAFYTYHGALMEPWDGPAALVFTDGQTVGAALDRNGLRPLRFWVLDDGTLVAGSETGVVALEDGVSVTRRGRLGPGQMLAVDVREGRLWEHDEINRALSSALPYREWVTRHVIHAPTLGADGVTLARGDGATAQGALQRAFGYSQEDVELIFKPMHEAGHSPVGSMGDDTPLAVFSKQPQPLYRYFKQRFAQVTNPPIDSLRERRVMSLSVTAGRTPDLLREVPDQVRLVEFASPVLSPGEFEWLQSADARAAGFMTVTLSALWPAPAEGADPDAMGAALRGAVEALCAAAAEAVAQGASILVLSDRGVDATLAPIPMLLAVSAVHQHLIGEGTRLSASLVCDSGDVREDHHFACLIGYGALLVHPYLAYETIAGQYTTTSEVVVAIDNYRHAVEGGLLKVMARMGISTLNSYQGAQIFETLGLHIGLVDRYFCGTDCRLSGATLDHIARDSAHLHCVAFADDPQAKLQELGTYRYRKHGEHHAFNPDVFKSLHAAVRKQRWESYQTYARLVDEQPACNIRDLITWAPAAQPLPLSEVEPAADIVRRFSTQAMSHGALASEVHEALAVAMNRLGGLSNSGEGGEDPGRAKPYTAEQGRLSPWKPQPGDWGNSAIKQVASARFGVTPAYLVSAAHLEVKMAQGSKPGEGGQIPGFKVTEEIAALRRAVPGTPLISPPPHHDIYSIEDLAQLIYDLKRINPTAQVGVKLVSTAGIGTIAAGVVKAKADYIQISGCDGGTGASPLASIKHAGVPWELGLAEAQQVLIRNDLRGRVLLRVDGGMRTGRDVVIAALLGAEAFGFGTTALIAAGCVMARRCHTNACPVGIATQDPKLRAKFPGTPEHVIACMLFVAEQTRLILAELGVRTLAEVIGRVDLLRSRDRDDTTTPIDLTPILRDPDPTHTRARYKTLSPEDRPPHDPDALDGRVAAALQGALSPVRPQTLTFDITNRDRSVGARLSGDIARLDLPAPLPDDTFTLRFNGVAGQSFGVFCNHGMHLILTGEAQDYVGKGMHGGEVVIRPQAGDAGQVDPVLAGNTLLYGATGGSLWVAGRVGERLAVRNAGATAVVEGCGDHGCEYMTQGCVAILGPTGHNFGAGMSGGLAYVWDPERAFPLRLNPGMVSALPLSDASPDDTARLKAMISQHAERTQSPRAISLLRSWAEAVAQFWIVRPTPT
jgi:glutamate synthase (ferredoxin)